MWRFDGKRVVIERLTPAGTYAAVESSGFLPIRAEDVRRWVVDEDSANHSACARRFRAEIQTRMAAQNQHLTSEAGVGGRRSEVGVEVEVGSRRSEIESDRTSDTDI